VYLREVGIFILESSTQFSRISVIVPHYNDVEGLSRCLDALERQTYPRDRFEIIVGDNNSPVGIEVVTRAVGGRARLAVITEKGAAAARNGAMALARHDVFAFTDSDCVPHPDWLQKGIRLLDRHDLVGGRMEVFVGDRSKVTPAEAFELVFAFDNENYIRLTNFSVTANLFTRRAIFEAVGAFSCSGASEDVEWCQRAVSRGYRLGYDSSAVVAHPARPNWFEVLKKTRRTEVEMFKLKVRSNTDRLRWLLRSFAYPLSAVVHTPKVLTARNLSGIGQRMDALAMLYRVRFVRASIGLRLLLTEAVG
jgi:cellulose synthase/poly-beta-1,6-N-acetylglucosamine synthase-like glycosyltransferase